MCYLVALQFLQRSFLIHYLCLLLLQQPISSLRAHLQYLRELLDLHALHALMWMDIRDMIADEPTKGSVDRITVHLFMFGETKIVHEPKLWKSLCCVSLVKHIP